MSSRHWIGRIICLMVMITLLGGGCAVGEFAEQEWYQAALKGAEMSLGNNFRLKQVLARAASGEHITIGTIGGSITEGAGAASYGECWASRVAVRFGSTYGVDGGSNVELINAGVGGTASPFGYMRYGREIVGRVSPEDPDGYPDLVIVEYSVNDWQEPTGHRCYESMVKEILQQPNHPAVILLFAVFKNGWNLQEELRKIGDRYDLMMVSIRDGIYPRIGKEIPADDFFFDEYHPKSAGHRMMADCIMQCIADAAEAETSAADINLNAEPVYGTDFMGLKTVFADGIPDGITVSRGGFTSQDFNAYRNHPVGLVCGTNFYHDMGNPPDPLTVTGTFSRCLIAWKASQDAAFGVAEVLVDGEIRATLKGGDGKWGQSEVALVLDEAEAAEHTVEIRVTERTKKFTVTAISVK